MEEGVGGMENTASLAGTLAGLALSDTFPTAVPPLCSHPPLPFPALL